MSTSYQRSTNFRAYNGARLLADLAHVGVDVPDEVTDANTVLTTLADRAKQSPTPGVHRQALVAQLLADPDTDVAAGIVAEATAPDLTNLYTEAADQARAALTRTLYTHADTIVADLDSTVFTPAVDALTHLATTSGPTDTTTSLLQAGNTTAARLLADAPVQAATILHAYRLRDRLYHGSDIEKLSHRRWRNPDTLDLETTDNTADYYLAGLRQGGQLWLGTYTQVYDASRTTAPQPLTAA